MRTNNNDQMKVSVTKDQVRSALLGVAVGDALGVPVEFRSRLEIYGDPVKDMVGFGTHNQPPGTFSDDSSMTFCLAESIADGFSLETVAENFIKWLNNGYWTAHGDTFDAGNATREAISRLAKGTSPLASGGISERSNGNGSLMRILPLVFLLRDLDIEERYKITSEVSGITHAHVCSVMACFYYLEFARRLLIGEDKFAIYRDLRSVMSEFLTSKGIDASQIARYERLLVGDIFNVAESEINSDGFVVSTLEASIWCLLTTSTFAEAVLKAVNLGEDTDTTGAVTGGLAGLMYGIETIPQKWTDQLARCDEILQLADRVYLRLGA